MRIFGGTDTYSAKRMLLARLAEEISGYAREYILNINVDELVDHLVDKYHLEVPRIDFERKEIVDEGEAGRGSYVTVAFPYEGSIELLAIQPTSLLMASPEVDFREGEFRITYMTSPESRSRLKQEIDGDVRAIETNLKNIEIDWKAFNDELDRTARLNIQQRRDRLMSEVQFVETLGIPIRPRTDMPATGASGTKEIACSKTFFWPSSSSRSYAGISRIRSYFGDNR